LIEELARPGGTGGIGEERGILSGIDVRVADHHRLGSAVRARSNGSMACVVSRRIARVFLFFFEIHYTYRLVTVAILPVLFSLKKLYKYLKLSHYWIYHETFTHLLSICSIVFRKQIVKFAAVKRLVISKTKEDGFLVIFTVCTTRTNTVASADEPISPSTNSSVPSATDKNKSHEVLYILKCFAQT